MMRIFIGGLVVGGVGLLTGVCLGFNRPEATSINSYQANHVTSEPFIVDAPEPVMEEGDVVPEPDYPPFPIIEEPYPVYPARPLPIGLIESFPPPLFYEGNEIDTMFYQFCESSTDLGSCSRYGDLVTTLVPKVKKLADLVKSSFDEDEQQEVLWMIRNIVENKFYEVASERSKFTISFVWITLQEYVIDEDVEDIDSRLGDAISNFKSTGSIVAVSEAPGDLTSVQGNVMSSSNNSFGIEVDAQFDSGRAATPEQGYEVLAYFGDMGAYFINREFIRHAQYDHKSKTRKFEGPEGHNFMGTVPDVDKVSIHLLCQYCDAEPFHQDRGDARVADSRSYTFAKLDNNYMFDLGLEVTQYSASSATDNLVITSTYSLTNHGVETLAGVRANIWMYPLEGKGRGYSDNDQDRSILSAVCDGNSISEEDFLAGNIVLNAGASCTISESVTMNDVSADEIELSINTETRQDQNRENNSWNKRIEL